MTVSRHEFLARLHHLLTPRGYLEVGVQFGHSLRLSSCPAIGIDPDPHVATDIPNAIIFPMTSDAFFARPQPIPPGILHIDLAFIDGSHLYEDALKDFINIEAHSNKRTVIVFDDVLPYNKEIAARIQPPGDWTGDVWKVIPILQGWREDLSMMLVDTFPTGSLVVWNLDPKDTVLSDLYPTKVASPEWMGWDVPDEILFRTTAVTADEAVDRLKEAFGL